jgi:hypothetical protein
VSLHVTAVVVVGGCAAMCWWQVTRALGGNGLSWAYVFEWPFFAGYAIFLWWRLVHEQPGERDQHSRHPEKAGVFRRAALDARPPITEEGPDVVTDSGTAGPPSDELDDPDAEEREAYNRYLAELDARGRRSRW